MMKKRNFKSLQLKKSSISNLNGGTVVVNGSDTMCLTCNWCSLQYSNCRICDDIVVVIQGQDSMHQCQDSIQNCPVNHNTGHDAGNHNHNASA